MLTQELKAAIRELWNLFWSGGIANSLAAIEQISYLMFLRRIEELDKAEEREAQRRQHKFQSRFLDHEDCRWSHIKEQRPETMLQLVRDRAFPFLQRLSARGDTFAAAMRDAVFSLSRASLLVGAVEIIDTLPITDLDLDTQGDLYEELLRELNLAGKNGQFRTPRHIVRVMVELIDPVLGELIGDPAAGTGGFLVGAFQWLLKSFTPPEAVKIDPDGSWHHLTGEKQKSNQEIQLLSGEHFVGYDFDTTMVRLGLMNMMLHGIHDPQFCHQDALADDFQIRQRFDVILSNPPLAGSIDRYRLNPELHLRTTKTELLFIELCLRLLKTGGRCAIIVPEGVLFNSSNVHRQLRAELVDANTIEAIISLPGGCFKPYTGGKAAIVLFRKGGSSERVWFYEVTGDGYTLDERRVEDPSHNDLRYLPQAYRIKVRGSSEPWASKEAEETAARRSWIVSREEIAAHNWNLAPGLYRPAEVGVRNESWDPLQIIARVRELDAELTGTLTQLETMLRASRDE